MSEEGQVPAAGNSTRWETRAMHPWPGTVRGLILWLFGWLFIVSGGLNYLGTTLPDITRHYLAFPLTVSGGRAWVYGVLFIVVGGLALVSSYSSNRDRWGYLLAALWSGLWGCGYVCGWMFYGAPLRAVGASVVWVVCCLLLLTCQRIPAVTFEFLVGGHE